MADALQSPGALGGDASDAAPRPRRNIVLLSDGTGNSAAKLNRTDVWELYQALDLGKDDQLALYDDGVGTSGFRPFQVLGGRVRVGPVAQRARPLRVRLSALPARRPHLRVRVQPRRVHRAHARRPDRPVRHPRPDQDGTAAPIVSPHYEEIQLNTHAGLKAGVSLAYRSYRRIYNKAPFARLYRWLRDALLRKTPEPDEFRSRYSLDERTTIKFVGVWDTVDAVGLPVDELSTMIDRLFYPHRFADQDLSPQVERACHAIAIDDERSTFHPVLWNEGGTADSRRIKQVWFPGMHSDVGGGYPDDDLARISLCWMIGEVNFDPGRGEGLRFDQDRLRAVQQRAEPLGKMHDSRRGLGVYYRYRPRHVASLCDDKDNGVKIARPKIHHSVLKRIANNTAGYAPAGLPTSYQLVDPDGRISDPGATAIPDAKLLERARHHVFWRQILYFMFVFVTLALLFMPYYRPALPGAVPESLAETIVAMAFGWLPALLPGSLGAWAGYWTDAWAQSPWWFGGLAAIYGLLLWHSGAIDAKIRRLSEAAWWNLKQLPGNRPPEPPIGPFEWLARQWRRSSLLRSFHRQSVRWGVPVLAAAFSTFLVAGAIYRVALHLPAVGDGVCQEWLAVQKQADIPRPMALAASLGPTTIALDTRVPCLDTGLRLEAGQRYVIEVTGADGKALRGADWRDAGYSAGPSGLADISFLGDPAYLGGFAARRHLALPWFALVAEIGRDSGQVFPLSRTRVTWTAPQSGRLYLYVNDAINPGLELGELNLAEPEGLPITPEERQTRRSSAWYANYLNNAGTAIITISPDE